MGSEDSRAHPSPCASLPLAQSTRTRSRRLRDVGRDLVCDAFARPALAASSRAAPVRPRYLTLATTTPRSRLLRIALCGHPQERRVDVCQKRKRLSSAAICCTPCLRLRQGNTRVVVAIGRPDWKSRRDRRSRGPRRRSPGGQPSVAPATADPVPPAADFDCDRVMRRWEDSSCHRLAWLEQSARTTVPERVTRRGLT